MTAHARVEPVFGSLRKRPSVNGKIENVGIFIREVLNSISMMNIPI
jgi:hypothetical protein